MPLCRRTGRIAMNPRGAGRSVVSDYHPADQLTAIRELVEAQAREARPGASWRNRSGRTFPWPR